MKTVINFVVSMLSSIGQASYAAHLARNQQYARARAVMEKK